MKKIILGALAALLSTTTVFAQHYRESRFYNQNTNRLDYSDSRYFGFRVGLAFTTVNSDDALLDGGSTKTGLNIGVAAGFPVTYSAPLFIETGLYYTEKGGNGSTTGKKFKYNLDYLEVPIVFKYKYNVDNHFAVEPFLGGYLALGVGGKIKNFGDRKAYSSFGDEDYTFQRFDGGLKLGVGASYDLFYAELAYDLGLSNICHDDFDASHNRALFLNVGVNF